MAVDNPNECDRPGGGGGEHPLERFLEETIPLTRPMGVRLREDSPARLVLTAPHGPNRNVQDTAFGGSLVSLAILAGYGVVRQLFNGEGGDSPSAGMLPHPAPEIVIRDVQASFREAVRGEIVAVCDKPDAATVEAFRSRLRRFGMAKMVLEPQIVEDGGMALNCRATFVVSVK